MIQVSGLVKLWHKPPKQVRHTMFFFDDKFPMIAHTPADCGETLYYEPHSFMLLTEQFSKVKNWERISLPVDAIELRGSNVKKETLQ